MPKQIAIEEIMLKPLQGSVPAPTAFCVIVDGKRSPLYFNRREAEDAVAAALDRPDAN